MANNNKKKNITTTTTIALTKRNNNNKNDNNKAAVQKADLITRVQQVIEHISSNADLFLDGPNAIKEKITSTLAELYEYSKKRELQTTDSLEQLVLEGFDNEQIWSQLQLFTEPSIDSLSRKLSKMLKDLDEIFLYDIQDDEEEQDDSYDEDLSGSLEDQDIDDEGIEQDDDDDEFDEEEDEEEEEEEDSQVNKKSIKKGGYREKLMDGQDIDFFKEQDMEKFLDDEDDKGEDDDDENFDLELGNLDSDADEEDEGGLGFPEGEMDEEERRLEALLDKYDENEKKDKNAKKKVGAQDMKFDDFFADPDAQDGDEFPIDGQDDYNEDEDEEEDQEEEEEEEEEEQIQEQPTASQQELTAFQKRALKIQEKIAQLEKDNILKKKWTVIGEASARDRPVNSVLEEALDFDHTQKLAPVQSQETNTTLEDIIKKRILDQNFDDVIRKTEEDVDKQYKEKLELNDQKNTEGLASVYEKSFLEKSMGVEVDSKLKYQHDVILTKLQHLMYKLSALSNFNFTPKKVKDLKITNQPGKALAVEEKIPSAASSASLVAPSEVYFKKNADEKGDTEKSKQDRKQERKEYKNKWRHDRIEKEQDEHYREKLDPALAKANEEKRSIKKLEQSRNTTIVDSSKSHEKYAKSGQFFSKLQQENDNKRKGIEPPTLQTKQKTNGADHQSKKFKL
ncbi:U3 snoRNP protein [Cavenderia fasciculata]|uniref:U3 small nucleolar ribonucleoprotein protein MPP10 n=1 Tax=Cavenderia fasciculata TaxID=261658 RepID=F4Q8L8_CACFS|nr:U3 snoRNP protein [Cavenderia fasciculata]EGG16118.1 U3 snoRNP protein [Cavenderia fasciculata]|eukprot:XP_004352449.1 U3 snoRNP protein [Cavenderia fasciculata]